MHEGDRLQKVLAAAGLGSRRTCEILIDSERVIVNGEVAPRPTASRWTGCESQSGPASSPTS